MNNTKIDSRFFSTFGRLPRTWVTLLLMVASGISEGFGIALFVPILELLDGKSSESWIVSNIKSQLSSLGLELTLPIAVGGVVIFIIAAFGLYYVQARMLIRAKHNVTEHIRQRLFTQLIKANWDYISKQAQGDIVNLLATESLRYGQTLVYQVQIIATLILVFIYSGFNALLSWKLLVLVIFLGTCFLVLLRPFTKAAKRLGHTQLKDNKELLFHTIEFLKSSKLIKVTSSERRVINIFKKLNKNLSKTLFSSENITEQSYFFLQSLPVIAVGIVILTGSTVFNISTSYMLVFLALLARTAPRLAQVQQFFQQYLLRRPAIDAIDHILTDSKNMREENHSQKHLFTDLEQEITFNNVTFFYPSKETPSLENASFSIQKNTQTAFVGRSGSGKSTIIDLLAGLRTPSQGEILFDRTDVRSLDLNSLRTRIGYVTQDITIFNDTFLNNLLFSCPDACNENLQECIKLAHLDDVIKRLPNGLDTQLEENGTTLSGGEKQRLALARALLRQPDILLLDEATSALDNESEHIIRQAISVMTSRMTVIVVAHRLSSIKDADKIIVLDKGRIIEEGTFEALMASGGYFADLNEKSGLLVQK